MMLTIVRKPLKTKEICSTLGLGLTAATQRRRRNERRISRFIKLLLPHKKCSKKHFLGRPSTNNMVRPFERNK